MDLQGADLRYVDFRGADLREVNMQGALLEGAQFDDKPLPVELQTDEITSICSSRMDDFLYRGYQNGQVKIFKFEFSESTGSFIGKCIQTIDAHKRAVIKILKFESTVNYLVTLGKDQMICVWDLENNGKHIRSIKAEQVTDFQLDDMDEPAIHCLKPGGIWSIKVLDKQGVALEKNIKDSQFNAPISCFATSQFGWIALAAGNFVYVIGPSENEHFFIDIELLYSVTALTFKKEPINGMYVLGVGYKNGTVEIFSFPTEPKKLEICGTKGCEKCGGESYKDIGKEKPPYCGAKSLGEFDHYLEKESAVKQLVFDRHSEYCVSVCENNTISMLDLSAQSNKHNLKRRIFEKYTGKFPSEATNTLSAVFRVVARSNRRINQVIIPDTTMKNPTIYCSNHHQRIDLLPYVRVIELDYNHCFGVTEDISDRLTFSQGAYGVDTLDHVPPYKTKKSLPLISNIISEREMSMGKIIGEGAFGTVQCATWLRKGHQKRTVAVTLLTHSRVTLKNLCKFNEEAATLDALDDIHVVKMHSVLNSYPYGLVLDYCENSSLRDVLKSKGQELKWEIRLSFAQQMSAGLAYIHSKKVIHADLKSPNILIGSDNVVKLCDFGLSSLNDNQGGNLGRRGTLRWMAPEIICSNNPCTFPCDVYSQGMVLWEIASTKIPLGDLLSNTEVIQHIESGKRETFGQRTPNIPKTYKRVVEMCWQSRPEDRCNIRSVVNELQTVDLKDVDTEKSNTKNSKNNDNNNRDNNSEETNSSQSQEDQQNGILVALSVVLDLFGERPYWHKVLTE